MSVLDPLQSQELITALRGSQRLGHELKSKQRLGSHSVLTGRVFSANAVDYTSPSTGAPHEYEIEFLPEDDKFGGALAFNVVVVRKLSGGGTEPVTRNVARMLSSDGRQRWRHKVPGNSEQYKVYFFTTGSGTFTINLL